MTEQEWLDNFGFKLVTLMRECGYNQTDLAKGSYIPRTTINRYVHGKRMPNVKDLVALSYTLGVTFDELMDFGERVW